MITTLLLTLWVVYFFMEYYAKAKAYCKRTGEAFDLWFLLTEFTPYLTGMIRSAIITMSIAITPMRQLDKGMAGKTMWGSRKKEENEDAN